MKVFLTGGTGFIGKSLARKLVDRGDEVYALSRSLKGDVVLESIGAHPVRGEICDIDSMRSGMAGCDLVFHVAGWYKLGSTDQEQAEKINIEGTRNVLSLAYELRIPKIIYTSTVAVFGDTHGKLVDETYRVTNRSELKTIYDHTKWQAHYEVAQPLIQAGAPIVILLPGVVYGHGDHSLVGDLMHRYYYDQFPFPIFPAPDMVLTYAHLDDIVEGHILAAEKGVPGESYILAGPVLSGQEAVKIWSRVTGKPEPVVSIPGWMLTPFSPLLGLIGRWVNLPELFSQDAAAILTTTYIASAEKARTELGWEVRPVPEGMRATFEAMANEEGLPDPSAGRQKRLGVLILSLAFGFLLYRRLRHGRRS